MPRSLRRLARVLHAFGPLSPALFHVLGGGAEEACFEDDFGLGAAVVIEAMRASCGGSSERSIGAEFRSRCVNGDLLRHALDAGTLDRSWFRAELWEPDLMASLDDALERGMRSCARSALARTRRGYAAARA